MVIFRKTEESMFWKKAIMIKSVSLVVVLQVKTNQCGHIMEIITVDSLLIKMLSELEEQMED